MVGRADAHPSDAGAEAATACKESSEQKQPQLVLSFQEPLPTIREAEDAVWSRGKGRP